MKIELLTKDKILLFIARRVLIVCVILILISGILFAQRLYIIGGLLIGTLYGLLRFYLMVEMYKKLFSGTDTHARAAGKSAASFALSLLGAALILTAAVVLNHWLFAGSAAGMLLVPLVVFINGLTESIGLTHNNFE